MRRRGLLACSTHSSQSSTQHRWSWASPEKWDHLDWQGHQGDALSYHDLFPLAVWNDSSKSETITANKVSHLIAVRSRLGRLNKVLHQGVQGLPGISCAGNLYRIRQRWFAISIISSSCTLSDLWRRALPSAWRRLQRFHCDRCDQGSLYKKLDDWDKKAEKVKKEKMKGNLKRLGKVNESTCRAGHIHNSGTRPENQDHPLNAKDDDWW